MLRRSSGSLVEDDATEDSLVSRPAPITPIEDYGYGPNVFDSPENSRSQVARRGTSFDLRRDNGSSTPRSRNSIIWRTLSSSSTTSTTTTSTITTATPQYHQQPIHDPTTAAAADSTPAADATVPKPPIMMPLASSASSSSSPSSSHRLPMGQHSPPESSPSRFRHARLLSPWSCSILTVLMTFFASVFMIFILRSFGARQVGSNGCGIPVMSPTFIRMLGFDTEHTRFASKYNLYLYREEGVNPYNQENIGVGTTVLVYLGVLLRILLLTLNS